LTDIGVVTNITAVEWMMKKIEILLVEDNADDAELTLLAFEKGNIIKKNQIHVARDGVEALEYLFDAGAEANLHLNHCPQLILLDLKLPKLDGLDLLKKIKSHPEAKRIPVVILTGSKDMDDWTESYSLGAECFLHKSCDFDTFVEATNLIALGAIEEESSVGEVEEKTQNKGEILLVEDDPDDAELTSLAFEKNGNFAKNKIHVTRDGVEALEYIFGFADEIDKDTPLKRRPKLILLDLTLPKINGLEVLKRIKSHPEAKNIPVVVLTGSKDWMDWTNALSLGVEHYIEKPLKSDQIVDALNLVNLGGPMQGTKYGRTLLCPPFSLVESSTKGDDKKGDDKK
jgi:two-component system response regulator